MEVTAGMIICGVGAGGIVISVTKIRVQDSDAENWFELA